MPGAAVPGAEGRRLSRAATMPTLMGRPASAGSPSVRSPSSPMFPPTPPRDATRGQSLSTAEAASLEALRQRLAAGCALSAPQLSLFKQLAATAAYQQVQARLPARRQLSRAGSVGRGLGGATQQRMRRAQSAGFLRSAPEPRLRRAASAGMAAGMRAISEARGGEEGGVGGEGAAGEAEAAARVAARLAAMAAEGEAEGEGEGGEYDGPPAGMDDPEEQAP